VRIFNEKEVDELVLLDIDATAKGESPDYEMIRNVAAECRMPLCYGGGIKTVAQAVEIINLGVEKVAVGAVALSSPQVVADMAKRVGSQSVVAVLDVKKNPKNGSFEVWSKNASENTQRLVLDCARQLQDFGVGEIILNSVDNDGIMSGYDLPLVRAVRAGLHVPITVLGGAGSFADIEALVAEFGVIGAAAGSLFVFKGVYKAVLINYLTRAQRDTLAAVALQHAAKSNTSVASVTQGVADTA
jgi:cyclase